MTALGIDEICVFHHAKSDEKYVTVVRNPETGDVLHVGDGKGVKALEGFAKRIRRWRSRAFRPPPCRSAGPARPDSLRGISGRAPSAVLRRSGGPPCVPSGAIAFFVAHGHREVVAPDGEHACVDVFVDGAFADAEGVWRLARESGHLCLYD